MTARLYVRRSLVAIAFALLFACGTEKGSSSKLKDVGQAQQAAPGCIDVGPGGCGCGTGYYCVGSDLWYCNDGTGQACFYQYCAAGCVQMPCGIDDYCA